MTKNASTATTNRALLYLRVSTPSQTNTAIDVDPDGNSIATQRVFAERRAASVNATIEREFVEPGMSAQSIEKRPVFRELLAYVDEHPEVTHVVIYMRSRAFRNAADAVVTKRRLETRGVKLISAKEDFGEGYIADAMEGIVDIFNEMEVRRNGEDIKAKLRNKAINGGTISRAKLGYLNIRVDQDGRLFNSIGIDEQRAPLVRQVFELYATGDYPVARLEAAAADLGLMTRPTARWPQAKPVSDSKLHQMLADPYYAGWVVVDGRLIKGRHEAIVSQELFDRVQEILTTRSKNGSRDRVLKHYLKGMLFCQRCHQDGRTSRLMYTEARGRNGALYGYFLCRARQDGYCDLPHLPAAAVEQAIERNYATLELPTDFLNLVEAEVTAVVTDQVSLTQQLHDTYRAQLAKLDAREGRLIDLAADGMLSRDKIRERQNQLVVERERLRASLSTTDSQLEIGAQRLKTAMQRVRDVVGFYRDSADSVREQLNRTFYERFYIDDEPLAVADEIRRPPFDELGDSFSTYNRYKELSGCSTNAQNERSRSSSLATPASLDHQSHVLGNIFPVSVSSRSVLVEVRGLEPLTPCMPCRCATSCATPPRTRHTLANPCRRCEIGSTSRRGCRRSAAARRRSGAGRGRPIRSSRARAACGAGRRATPAVRPSRRGSRRRD
jgi:site-specific DNA recombinase